MIRRHPMAQQAVAIPAALAAARDACIAYTANATHAAFARRTRRQVRQGRLNHV